MTLNVVTGYGAVGDYNPATGSGTDDTTAFTNAISAAQSTGQELYVPAGNYKITSPTGGATVLGSASWAAGTGARIYGDGQFASNIYFIGNTGTSPPTIQLSGQNSFLRDLGIVARYTCNNLLEIGPAPTPAPPAGSGAGSYIQIANCRFAAYSDTDSFAVAIFGNTASYSAITGCLIIGQPYNSGGTRVFNGTGISFDSSINNSVTQNTITFLSTGILINPANSGPPVVTSTQGLLISQNTIFGNATGVSIQSSSTSASEYVSVVNNIIDYSSVNGIAVNEGSGSITSNYIGLDTSHSTATAGIIVANSDIISVVGNTLIQYGTSTSTFAILFFENVNSSMISSNGVYNFAAGIVIGSTCSNCVATGNSGLGYTGTGFVTNNSTTSVVANNTN